MANDNDKIKIIYTTLKDGGADVGTEKEFNDWFLASGKDGYENRKSVYDALTDGGADAGRNYEEFRDWLGLHAVDGGAGKHVVHGDDGADAVQSVAPAQQPVSPKPQAPQQQGKQEPGFFSRLWQSAKDAFSSAGQTGPEGHAVAAGAAISNMLQQGTAARQPTQQRTLPPNQPVSQTQKDAQQAAQAAPKQNVEPGQVSPQDAWRNQPITVGYLTKGQHDTTQGAVYDQMYKDFESYYNNVKPGQPSAIRYLRQRAMDYGINEGNGGLVVTPGGNKVGDVSTDVINVTDPNGTHTEVMLGSGKANELADSVLNSFLRNKARAAAEELAKKIPFSDTDTAMDSLRANYYNSDYQRQLWDIAGKSGVSYKHFIDSYMKPALDDAIKSIHNGMNLHVGSLFSDWNYAADEGKKYDPNALNADERKLFDVLMTDFDQRLSADRATARGKANELAGRETASNLAIGGREGHAMQLGVPMETLREYNAYADPSKAVNYVLDKLMGNGGGNVIAGGNGDGINRQAIGNLLYRKIMDKLVQERIPKSKWGYVLKGFMDGDIGELFKNYTQTDFERHLDNLADKKYMQSLKGFSGMLATGGHEATKFLSDAWEYYLGGKVGSAVTGALRKRAIKRFAGDLVERGIQRNVAEAIAARAFQRTAQNAGRKAVMGAVHGAGTMGTAGAISGTLRQSISPAAGEKMDEILQRKANGEQISKQQEAQEIAEANKEAHSITSVLGAGAEGGLRGAVAGLTFGPGTYVGASVSKWASKYMGDLASAATGYTARLGTNAASATALGQAEGAITGEKPEGSIGNQFAQNLVTFALLDAQGAAPRMLNSHPIKSYRAWKEYERSYGISTEDQQRMRDAGYGDLIDTIDGIVSERFRDKGSSTLPNSGWKPQEESTRINEGMMKLLSDATLPEELKRKYYSLVTGDDSKQLSPVVASEVTTDEEGNHYLVTYNKYGNVVSDRQYHNEKSAQNAQMKIGHEQDENLTDALQQGVFAKDADALMEHAYHAAVEAFKNGDGSLGKGQQTLLYLYQNKERLTKALAAAGTGEPLPESDQRLVSLFNTVQKQLFDHDANSHDGNIYNIARAAEAANGLASNSMYIARKGHTEKEAKKLAEENGEEAIHIGGDVWRTASEDAAVKDYQQRLYDYMSGEKGQGAEVKEPGRLEYKPGEEAATQQLPTEPSAPDATQQPPTEPSAPDATQQLPTEPIRQQSHDQAVLAQLQKRRNAGYDRGMGIDSDKIQLAQIQHDIDFANQRFNQAFGDGNMNAFRNGMIDAVKNDDEDAMRKLLDKYEGQLNDEQKEATYGLIEIGAVQNGIDDSITSQTMEYRDQRQQELTDISDAQGNITRLTLADGTKVYLKNGDITNEYGGVMVVDENGETKQIPVSSIKQAEEPVSAQQQLDDDTNAFAEDLKTGYQRLASGADMLPGQQANINISGQMFHVTVDRKLEDGRYQLIMDDGSPIVLTSDEMQQAVAAARNKSVSTELVNQQQQRAAQETEARRTKGIAGYAEGKPDLGAAETEPVVAGEYLRQQQAADGKDPLPGIESEIEALKSAQQQAQQDFDRHEQWMEINNDLYTPEDKATKESIIKQRKKEIADTRQRIRKLGEVRNAYMSQEQRMKFRNDRMRKSEEARKTAFAEWQKARDTEKPKQATVDGIDNKTLLDNYATQADAEDYLQRRREEILRAYRGGASNTIADVQRHLQDYTNGLEELTNDDLKSLYAHLAEAKDQERIAMEQAKQIKAQQQKLGTLYKERNKAELDKMEPADRRAVLLKGARTPAELLKKAHEAYKGSDFESRLDDLEPETLEEYVSQNLGYGTLNWEGTGTGISKKNGLKQELGLTRGIGHGFDSNGINAYLAPKGQGMSVDMATHKMWKDSRGTQFDSYDDQDFKNAILDLLGSSQKATDIKYLTIRNRIKEVEDYERAQEEQERWYKEQEDEELKARQQDIDMYNDYLNAIAESNTLTPEQESYLDGLYADEIAEAEQEEADREAAWEAYEAEKEEEQLKQNNDERTATETNGSGSEVDSQSEPRADDSGDGKSEETVPDKAAHQPAAETEHHAQREVGDRTAHTPAGDSDADGGVSLSAQKLKEIKKRASQFSAETEEESGAFVRLIPKMSDEELLAYMRLDGNGDPNEAYHPELYDEYDSRHNDEEVEAYNSYLQQLRDSGTTTEQAEDMLAKVQGDFKTYGATAERSMLTGQQDALIDYISELNHQEEKSPSKEQEEGQMEMHEVDTDKLFKDLKAGKTVTLIDYYKDEGGHSIGATDTPEKVTAERQNVNTEPTEGQKEAGNYKKGHIKVDGYDITIENPKGSTRSGKDASGKAWSVPMHYDYGYIKGTEGVDGDHIDVYLSDEPTKGNVYVVDQVNQNDGSFDEHKVMYGFPSMEAAVEAYKGQYEDGWKVGTVTEVSREDFKKWVESSHRKTKPFADYKSMESAAKQQRTESNHNVAGTEAWTDADIDALDLPDAVKSKAKAALHESGNMTDHFALVEARNKAEEQKKSTDTIKKAMTGKKTEVKKNNDEKKVVSSQPKELSLFDEEESTTGKPYYPIENGRREVSKGIDFPVGWSLPTKDGRNIKVTKVLPDENRREVSWTDGEGKVHSEEMTTDELQHLANVAFGFADDNTNQDSYGKDNTEKADGAGADGGADRPLGSVRPSGDGVLGSSELRRPDAGEVGGDTKAGSGLADRQPGGLSTVGSRGGATVNADSGDKTSSVVGGRRHGVSTGVRPDGEGHSDRGTDGRPGASERPLRVSVRPGANASGSDSGESPERRASSEEGAGVRGLLAGQEKSGKPARDEATATTRADDGSKKTASERNTPLNTRNYLYPKDGADIDNMSAKDRLVTNVDALETLARLVHEGRTANAEERNTLGKFRGWGGVDMTDVWNVDGLLRKGRKWDSSRLKDVTDVTNPYYRLGMVIKSLDPDGKRGVFDSIKQAALTSYYTPLPIARAMNEFLSLAGYKGGGSLLDPSIGNGVFEGTMPKDMQQRTQIYGVELDWLTAQIAKNLYPDAHIQQSGYQEAELCKDAFDVVESNIPFGSIKVYDPTWRHDSSPAKKAAQGKIHTYFALKMMENAKPGGLVTIMTSNSIMDTPGNGIIRDALLEQGEFLGAVRLPDNTFKGAGTRVVTDVIFMRKYKDEDDRATTLARDGYAEKQQQFSNVDTIKAHNASEGKDYDVRISGYYKANPKMMLGKVVAGGQYRGDEFGLTSEDDTNVLAKKMLGAIKKEIVGDRAGQLYDTHKSERKVYHAIRETYVGDGSYQSNGNIVEQNGKFGVLHAVSHGDVDMGFDFEENPKLNRFAARIRLYIPVRTALKKLIAAQINREPEKVIEGYRKELNSAYKAFRNRYGLLNDKANNFIAEDIDSYQMLSLEDIDEDTKKLKGLADIFTKNTIKPTIDTSKVKDPASAIATSLAQYGEVRPSFMEKLLGKDWPTLCGETLYKVPFSESYVVSDDYLSGDVKSKLEDAQRAAEEDPAYKRNVEALEKVQPRDIPVGEINIRMGARWVPDKVYTDFMKKMFGIPDWNHVKSGVRYIPESDDYIINVDSSETGIEADKWATDRRSAKDIFEAAMKDKSLKVYDHHSDGSTSLNKSATELANSKVQDLRETFETWVTSDPERADALGKMYNEKFNRTVIRQWSAPFLQSVGLQGMTLRPHQQAAVWMLLNNRGGIVDHIVGAGKTLVMQSAIMEMRRMGIAKKPMIIALKATVGQIAKEFAQAYPAAKILAPTEKDFVAKNRKKLFAQIATNDYDCVIVSHDNYVKFGHTKEIESQTLREQLQQLEAAIMLMRTNDVNGRQSQLTKRQLKGLEKRKANLEARMKRIMDRPTDIEFCFENLGVDYLFVDECQRFKSLPYATTYNQVAGLGDPTGSTKAVALLNGVRYLQQLHQGDRGTVFLSGTTITNSLVEVYNLLNYLRPNMMKKLGYTTFDAWAAQFAVRSSELEYGVTNELKEKNRFRYFQNVSELGKMYAEIADVRNDYNLKLPKPKPRTHLVTIEPSDDLNIINEQIVDMVKTKDGSFFGIDGNDKTPWSLQASNLSTKASVSPRLVDPSLPDDPHGKLATACENVAKIYKQFDAQKGTQLIFCDTGVPSKGKEYDAYTDIINRLVNDYGIPRKEIVDIHTANTDDKRKALFKKVRDGQVRILIGGTVNMGTGVNVQSRLVALHHIDIPWQPADTEQRNGRGVRQGNIIARDFNDNNVDIYYYAVKGTLDTYRYQLQDIKGKMFAQFKLNTIDSDSAREFDEGEIDADGEIDPAQMVAMLSGNPVIFEKSKQDKLVKKLRRQESSEYNDYLRRKRNIESLKSRKESFENYQRMNNRDKEFLERNGYDPSRPANDYKIVDGSGKEYPWKKATDAGKIIHKLWKSAKPFTLKGYGMEAHLVQNSSDLFGGQTILKPVSNHWALSDLPYSVPLSDTDQAAGQAFANLVKSIYHSGDAYKAELDKLTHKLEGSDKIGEFQFSKQKQLEEALAKKKELDAEYQKLSDETNNEAEQETGEPQGSQDSGDDGALYRIADEEEAAKLDKEPTVKVYRAMQLINGKLYPPMMAAVKGKLVEPRELGQWEVADERPGIIENIKKNKAGEEIGYVTLDKGSKDSTGKKGTPIKGVAYNPYWHTSRSPLNDQFKSAWIRPNIVTVEVEVPVSELRSGYRANYAKDPVGETDWHSGSVTKQLTAQGHSPRKVILSRYDKPVKVLSAAETAERIIDYIGDYDVTIPENVVTPQVRVELEKRGIKIGAPEKGVKKTEQIREAIERGLSVSDDMLRDTEVFNDGERLRVSIREGGYGVSGLNNDYRKLSDLLDAFRDKYPGYVATLVNNYGKKIDPYIDDLKLANRWFDGINIQVEPWRKYLSGHYKGAAQSAYVARKTRNALEAVKHWADKMNLGDKVTVLTSTDGLQGKKARAKGWFDKRDGKITIVLPNHTDIGDVIRTLLHEGVAHYGLRQLFGEHFNTFLDNVYNNANHSVKSRIRDLELKYDGDKHKATEEYLAGLAEDTDFEHTVNSSWWNKIKNMFLDMLAKVGLKLRRALTDADLRYVLWRSYENMKHPGEKRTPADWHLNEPIEEIEGEREPREAAVQRRPIERRGNVAADYAEEPQEHSGEMRPLKSANDDKLSITSLPPSTTIPVTEIDGESPVSVQDAIRVIDHLPGSVDTLDGYHLNVSRTTRNKLKNEISKHKNDTAVLAAMSHIEEIVGKSLLIEEHRDRMKIDGERKPDNPSDQNIEKTQRFYGAATIDGVPYRVKSTAIVSRNTDRTRMHNYEITKIELLSPIASTRQKAYTAVDNNSITLAKLLKNVEFSYEKGRKLLDEIENNGYDNAVESAGIKKLGKRYRMGEAARTYSEGEQRDMGNAAEELGETLGGVAVTIEHNGKDGIKGSFDTRDNTVHVNMDEADGIEDVEATVCHEVLGHEGLKSLFGSNKGVDMFGQFIYDNASKELRRRIVEKADEEGYEWTDPLRFSKAAQEVFSDIASEGPRNAEEFSLWRKVKHYVIRALKSLGIRIRGIVNDHDLRYYVLKTGKAVKKWSMMDEEAQREAAEPGRIMYSRRGKPRKRKDETMAQYIERLRTYERWNQAEEKAKAANDPMPEKEDYDQQAQDEYNKAMDDWRKSNNIQSGDKEPSEFPKRKDGESPQEYAIRVADYESQSDIWKTAPNMFDYMKKAQDEYHAAYEAWKTRYDLQEMENVDEKLYSGEPIPGDQPQTDEQHYDQLEVDHAVEQDAARELGDAVGMDLSAEGAQRHAKLAVIERRKNLESASADDAIFIHDLCRDIDALAKKKDMKPAELREKLIDVIESPVAQKDADKEVDKWVDVLNNMRAFQDAHASITADGVKAAMPELNALSHLYVKYGVKPSSYEQRKEIHEAAKALADKFNDYYKDTAGYNQLFGDDIMQVGKYIVKMSEAAYAAAAASKLGEDPDVKGIVDRIHDWYDNFFHVIEDAGLRGDAGYVENGYINHIWDKEKSDAGAWEKYVENYQRTKSGNMRHRTISTYADGIEVGLVPKFNDVAQIMSYYSRQNNEAIANKKLLDDLSFITVSELNKDGEVVRTLPVLNSHHPSRFDEERYKMYHVPGVGDVWVLNEVSRRFSSIFGTMRTQDIPDWLSKTGKVYDLLGSTMKKIQLSISGFHMGALSEVALAQMRPDRGMKAIFKYILLDSIRNHGEIPAYAHPEDFKLAASHLVQLGATQDYAASDVNMITERFRNYVRGLRKDEAFVKQAAGGALTPLAVAIDFINKGMDKLLWNYLHDGLKIACFKQFVEQIDRRVEKEGLTSSQRDRLLDEAGQYVNDTFGGQYWELLNVSPAALKWMRRALLSPDWFVSTQRHFFANFGFGSIYDTRSFGEYVKESLHLKRGTAQQRRTEPGSVESIDADGDIYRKFRSKEARLCYVLGVCVFFYTMMNGLNAVMRARDEAKEKEKADEMRKTNPDYKSPYELAYPDGMKWYDYTMLGNALGQQTHLFLGRYADGTEMYVRWGKQFREFPEMFIGRKGLDFPAPMIQRMMGKANPVIGLVRDNLGALGIWGFENQNDIEEIQAKYGKQIGLLAMNARHFLPFSLPTQSEKEFKMIDLFMPSSKGFTRYKTVDYFMDFIKSGDMEGVARVYRAATMNGIDAEKCLQAAITTLKAEQRDEMSDGIKDLSQAVKRYDAAKTLKEKKVLKNKLTKLLAAEGYKAFTRDEAMQMIEDYMNGDNVSEKDNDRYIELSNSGDIRADYRLSAIGKQAKKFVGQIKDAQSSGDASAAEKLANRYSSWIEINTIINQERSRVNKLKKQLGKGNDKAVMNEIREVRKQAQQLVDELPAPK